MHVELAAGQPGVLDGNYKSSASESLYAVQAVNVAAPTLCSVLAWKAGMECVSAAVHDHATTRALTGRCPRHQRFYQAERFAQLDDMHQALGASTSGGLNRLLV